jgi:DEAD/DEAH box helicase domain-containing protein
LEAALSDTVVFDIETKRGPREVGGWIPERMGLAVAVTWDEINGFREWFREDVKGLIRELSSFGHVVGFNVLRFDYRVLARYQRNVSRLLAPKTLDILADIYQALGFRVSLDNVARATLGRGKIATAHQAGKWWREGNRDLVAKYCRGDVELTRDIYAYGLSHGVIYYPYYWIRLLPMLRTKRAIRVNWSR